MKILKTRTMSLTVLKIIPVKPTHTPDKEQQEKAKTFLSELYRDEEIKFTTTAFVEFVDQGENFDSVSCNLCGQEMEIEHWKDLMDKAYKKRFAELDFITQCCNKKTSLNDLIYNMAAGFAKFVVNVYDVNDEIKEKDMKELQQILGAEIRIIWARY